MPLNWSRSGSSPTARAAANARRLLRRKSRTVGSGAMLSSTTAGSGVTVAKLTRASTGGGKPQSERRGRAARSAASAIARSTSRNRSTSPSAGSSMLATPPTSRRMKSHVPCSPS